MAYARFNQAYTDINAYCSYKNTKLNQIFDSMKQRILLEPAKRAVELVIEQNEEAALRFIEEAQS